MKSKEMKAAVLTAPNVIELQSKEIPTPEADEVLIRVNAVGICGSDVHFYHEGKLGDWVVTEPLVLGHEAGGTIVAVGRDVPESRVGERVAIEPQHPAPGSPETLRGDYHLDPDMRFYAVPGVDGAFQEYVTIQSHFAHAIPDGVSDNAAALMEPLSVAIASIRKAKVHLGDTVYIAGAGPIGIVTAQVAKASGATEIIVSDTQEARRKRALEFGATSVIDPISDPLPTNVDAFLDASGAVEAIRGGLQTLRPGGRAILVGMGAEEALLPLTTIQNKELIVTGVFRYANTWPTAIRLVSSGRVDLDTMVTGVFGLAEVQDALESTSNPLTMKSVVNPSL